MTRIYTNIPSLTAMKSLNRNMSTLGTSLERLSTGFRINSGKDDPAGLMASELLRSEITGVETGIKNTSRANSMIAVADSALGEVSRLLNEIRGLVTESANTGIMTEEMLYANQLQIDASLQAINRIAALTSFMGRNLLDGSLDVITTGVDRNALNDLQIHEVRFGTDGAPIPVNINVEKAATKAALYYNHAVLPEDITLSIGGNVGYTTQFFEKGTSVVSIAEMVNRLSSATGVVAELGNSAVAGQLLVSSTGLNNDIIIQAGKAGAAAGCIDVKFTPGDSEGIVVEYVESLGEGVPATINVKLRTESWANASAPRVDNTVDAQGNPIPDNNALQFKANTEGSQYNNASVYFVDGRKTQADFLDNGKTSAIGDPYAYYNDGPTRSRGLMGDINGLPGFTDPDTGQPLTGLYATVSASTPGAEYNNTAIQLVEDSARNVLTDGELAKAVYDSGSKMLRVYVNTSLGATFGDVAGAISWEGNFDMDFSDGSLGKNPPTGMAAIKINRADIVPDGAAGTTNTQNSGGDAGSLFIVLDPDKEDGYTANAISSIFNLHSQSSRGSERAADLFDVQPTVDNDGTGVIRLYASEEEKLRGISRKTSFQGVFEGGQTGGAVLSSAREVVTALNNSALWGTTMGENLLADLHVENTNGLYRDASDPPPLTARLAPGNHGLATVSVFEEVAYYGSPYDGTGLQFLGPNDSPKIRFVAEPGTTELSIDRTTAPDTVDYARAILNAKNPNASLLLTAHRKGEIYDDILIQIKKATDDPSRTDVDRAGGWAEYDPGESHAEALLAFNPLGTGVIPNTTFTMTANKRGVDSNNVPITMRSVPDQSERILVSHNPLTGAIDISLNRSLLGQITANDVITEINNADLGFTAALSEASSVDWGDDFTGRNNGTGTFEAMNLTNKPMEVGNTGSTGGHAGTVTVWMTNIEDATVPGGVRAPTANDVISVINRDAVLGGMFTASNYASGEEAGTGPIDFINDDSFVSGGGLIERGALTVHLVTDSSGLVRTTASDLVAWWDGQTPETTAGISVGVLRTPGDIWDECTDTGGDGVLGPTVIPDDCGDIFEDIAFVGWYDSCSEPYNYLPAYATGSMTSENGVDATYELVARRTGPEYNGYSIVYENDSNITGRFDDNAITGLRQDEEGNLLAPQTISRDGIYLELDERTKQITIHINEGATTAGDVKQLIENDPLTKSLFTVNLLGTGEGKVLLSDDTLLTTGGARAPGTLNGAKLLFSSDEDPWGIVFKSSEYGSNAFVDIKGIVLNGVGHTIDTRTADGNFAERTNGTDTIGSINGVTASSHGLNMEIVTDSLSMSLYLSENVPDDYATDFTIDGGGATFQLGPNVVSSQQLTVGIRSVDTSTLGGPSGLLYQLGTGKNADMYTDTNLAYKIVEEAIVSISTVRGRLGAMQKNTLIPNIDVLSDTLESLTTAESDIRDTDFAMETSLLTRSQVLVQANVSTLGTANQIPNYMLGLLQ